MDEDSGDSEEDKVKKIDLDKADVVKQDSTTKERMRMSNCAQDKSASSGDRELEVHPTYIHTYIHNKVIVPIHTYKRLCYCRGTARRATSVEILWPFFDWAINKKLC